MSQTWTDDTFAAGHVAQTDLQNMENNFACLKSCFSGATAPVDTVAFMLWGETDQKVLKVRNTADDGWYGLMHGDTSEKRLVYRDAAMDGYARDSGVTDKVIGLKGGAIYVTGGATAGTAGIPSCTLSSAQSGVPAHKHVGFKCVAAGTGNTIGSNAIGGAGTGDSDGGGQTAFNAGAAAAQPHDHGGSGYRPAAAVCILVYLDL